MRVFFYFVYQYDRIAWWQSSALRKPAFSKHFGQHDKEMKQTQEINHFVLKYKPVDANMVKHEKSSIWVNTKNAAWSNGRSVEHNSNSRTTEECVCTSSLYK